jgi:hypothetical protein
LRSILATTGEQSILETRVDQLKPIPDPAAVTQEQKDSDRLEFNGDSAALDAITEEIEMSHEVLTQEEDDKKAAHVSLNWQKAWTRWDAALKLSADSNRVARLQDKTNRKAHVRCTYRGPSSIFCVPSYTEFDVLDTPNKTEKIMFFRD